MQTSGKLCQPRRAFSLIEVVIAVGIFAVSIVAVIGLMAPSNKSVSEVRDADDTTRVVNAVQAELQRLAENQRFTTVGTTVGIGSSAAGSSNNDGFIRPSAPTDPTDGSSWIGVSTNKNFTLYASRDGTRIGVYADTAAWKTAASANDDSLKYFEIVLIRTAAVQNAVNLSQNSSSDPDVNAGFLAFVMRIRWPAYMPDGTEFAQHSQKSVLIVPAAVHR
ncbi:MAG: prepilin-type N-terminal cleavage/methylation domain-containing protein [Verrucomicrobia bacterium]|nr:prepilin-type N-terminal cleavage/methylation domain-containing protein [Verrucomicrobiota bacterium]